MAIHFFCKMQKVMGTASLVSDFFSHTQQLQKLEKHFGRKVFSNGVHLHGGNHGPKRETSEAGYTTVSVFPLVFGCFSPSVQVVGAWCYSFFAGCIGELRLSELGTGLFSN